MEIFDLVVIGAGPAGYTGAIRASQLGMKVVCIEKRQTLGGTCLNEGCIPSKALLNMSHKFEEAQNLQQFGIQSSVSFDLNQMQNKKNQIVSDLCNGIDGLFYKNKITKLFGTATILDSNRIEISNESKKDIIQGRNILIATGSEVLPLDGIKVNEKNILTSTGALNIERVPENLVIIGGGYIGLEVGSVWRRLGSKVTIIEYADSIVANMDLEIGKKFYQILQKQGMNFQLSSKVLGATTKDNRVFVEIENRNTKAIEIIETEILLLSIGRRPYTENLGLENVGILLDPQKRILVNNKYQTIIPNIYAVGDVIAGPMLAHKAEEEAIAAVEIIAGQSGHVNYNVIPSVVYTDPEVASVGKTEEQLKSANIEYKVGKFPFLANSRARSICSTEGMVKILADKRTDKILGAHIIGPEAGNLIAEIVIAMEFSASSEDIARTCHAHPTLNEAIKEAALNIDKRSINF
jgi:dihydrolipoamide dehydrogenase